MQTGLFELQVLGINFSIICIASKICILAQLCSRLLRLIIKERIARYTLFILFRNHLFDVFENTALTGF